MAGISTTGVGVMGYPHPTIANLWVRELGPMSSTLTEPLILTGVIQNVADVDIDNSFSTTNTFAHGCILTQVDGTTSLSAQWGNVGTAASPAWERWSS